MLRASRQTVASTQIRMRSPATCPGHAANRRAKAGGVFHTESVVSGTVTLRLDAGCLPHIANACHHSDTVPHRTQYCQAAAAIQGCVSFEMFEVVLQIWLHTDFIDDVTTSTICLLPI